MKIVITANAEHNLAAIYDYHAAYSFDHADNFHDEIVKFIRDNLSQFPESGAVYNPQSGIRRLIYRGNHNIYYVVRDGAAYMLFVIDGRGILNDELRQADDAGVDDIIG
jgi:plasmid stabilization system protein ParE